MQILTSLVVKALKFKFSSRTTYRESETFYSFIHQIGFKLLNLLTTV